MSTHDNRVEKLVIIGSGPAGYSAAIYAARGLLEPTLFAGFESGGQLMLTTEVENYAGFKDGIKGPDLMMQMAAQSERFGTKIIYEYVTAVDFSSRPFKIWTEFPDGITPDEYKEADEKTFAKYLKDIKAKSPKILTQSVILAVGASSVMVGVKGEKEFIGRGVSTCAVCDAAFYKDKNTFVIGGGDSAMEDAMALTKFAKSVTIVHRRDQFKASKIMQERVLKNPKVKVLWNSNLKEVVGNQMVEKIILDENGLTKEYQADGVFIAIGHKPVTKQFAGEVDLDEHGYIVTRQSLSMAGIHAAEKAIGDKGVVKFPSMTSVEGVFAAGDGVDLVYKQAITSAGQGAAASIDAERWLEQNA